jgi:hypothetical protein
MLAILDGHHALYKVGSRLEERGMVPLLQSGLDRPALHDYRLGQILDALFAANLNRVFGAVALRALEVYAISTPWLPQDTTTLTLYGAYEEATRPDGQAPQAPAGPVPPRPAYGHSKDGHDDLKQVLLRLGVSSDGGLPLRLGVRDGHTSESTETPVAIEACLALGLAGVRGMVAESKAYGKRTLGLCLEKRVGLITLVPRTCAVRQELEAWGPQQGALPVWLAKPGRTRQESPRQWHGQSVMRRVEVEDSDGRVALEALRFVVVHSNQLAQQAALTYGKAQSDEAERVTEHSRGVEARRVACAAEAEAALADYEGHGPRGGEAAGHGPGAIMPSAIEWRPASNGKNGRAEDARRRRSSHRKRSTIAWALSARRWSGPRTSRGGSSWRRLSALRGVLIPRFCKPIKSRTPR